MHRSGSEWERRTILGLIISLLGVAVWLGKMTVERLIQHAILLHALDVRLIVIERLMGE